MENLEQCQDKDLIKALAQRGYRISARIPEARHYFANAGQDQEAVLTALMVDVETTGLDTEEDRIIEFAAVKFTYGKESGKIFDIQEIYVEYNDPGRPIGPEITRLTGITNADVYGKQLDMERVCRMVSESTLIIAHNAKFDRKVLENLHPCFRDRCWACSCTQIPWIEEGIASAKLDYIAYALGFYFEGHRASHDCLATIHILAQQLPASGKLGMQVLLENARKKVLRLYASVGYAQKDRLKARGYSYAPDHNRSWCKDFSQVTDLEAEVAWLNQEMTGVTTKQVTISAKDLFSVRA